MVRRLVTAADGARRTWRGRPRCGATTFLAALLGLNLMFAGHGFAETRSPNVLIILTDDQGYGDFSCHGNPALETPNLDALHAESVRFTDFHVAPMCTPTRGQPMTGKRQAATTVAKYVGLVLLQCRMDCASPCLPSFSSFSSFVS